ncbi:COP23 domain-containing protein [Fischerella sp.]|uniref:COP23 domain-containing protein n=1 Tax=Fischerella sp. TaxID=1191 RepID=UPI0025C4075A|nr:COP23 domain-containing protein [Fischerella sp.]
MNKRLSWVTILGMAPIFAFSAVATVAQPSPVSSTINITCNTDTSSTPTAIATSSAQGSARNITIISFLPQYFSTQDAVQNCQNTAKILQELYKTGRAHYLTNDKLKAQPVVCAVQRRGVGCNHYSAQVLFALDAKVNSSQALYEMLGSDFKQSQPPDSRTVSRIYVDIKSKPWWQKLF